MFSSSVVATVTTVSIGKSSTTGVFSSAVGETVVCMAGFAVGGTLVINWYRLSHLHGQLCRERFLLQPVIVVKISICVL